MKIHAFFVADDDPDYITINIAGGIGINGTASIIIDRYGNVYISFGGEGGLPGLSGSATAGWVQKGSSVQNLVTVDVDEKKLESLLTGVSVSVSGGAGLGGAATASFGEENKDYLLTEVGAYFPSGAGGVAYSAMLYNANEISIWNSRHEYWYWYHFER